MNEDAHFLEAIKASPEDLVLRSVYADWLEERGDIRSEYLRADCELQQLIGSLSSAQLATGRRIRQLHARLKKLGKTLDPGWVSLFDALRPRLFRCRACQKVISSKEAIDTNPRSYRKMKTSRYCKLCFEDAVRSQLHRGLDSPGKRGNAQRDYHGGGGDED